MRKINELPGDARIWIYQADRTLTPAEEAMAWEKLESFLAEWTSHSQKMDAAGEIFYQRFLVIAADEKKAAASGCGIDKSVHFVRDLGQALGIDFFRRTQIIYMEDETISECELNLFWAKRKAGIVKDTTVVFDNTIRKVSDLENKWQVPFSESWHAEMWLK